MYYARPIWMIVIPATEKLFMEVWEQLLLGALGLGVFFLFRPGIKAAMQQSQQAESKDWKGLLFPIGLVVGFVVLLILMARG